MAIHLSLVLGVGVLITGSIWAQGRRGATWWVWDEPTLVSFLIVFLLYATYQPLRFSIEDPERQARYASVFAIVAGAFVPLNFARRADGRVRTSHPRTLGTTTGGMPGEMWLTFLVALVGMALLFVTLWKYEMAAKHARFQLKALRRTSDRRDAPTAGRSAAPQVTRARCDGYLAAAYLVFLALILIYVAIMAVRLRAPGEGARRARPSWRRSGRRERADPARHLAQDRAGRAARAARADRLAEADVPAGPRRGRRRSSEAVAISTCNRTEIYLVASDAVEGESAALGALAGRAGIRPTELAEVIYSPRNCDAARQLFRVTAGPRVDDRRRVRGPGPGQARLRGRAGGRHDRPADQPPVHRRAGRRQARAGGDRASGSAPRPCRRWPSTSRPRCSATSPAGPSSSSAPARRAS